MGSRARMTSTTGIPKPGPKGFTLVEILLTVVVLGIGSIMIQANMLRSAGIISGRADTLRIQVWLNEKLWETRERIVYSDDPSPVGDAGAFDHSRRKYDWAVTVRSLPIGEGTYAVRASGRRSENPNAREVVRETYVTARQTVP